MQSWIRSLQEQKSNIYLLISGTGVALCFGYVAGLSALVFVSSIYISAFQMTSRSRLDSSHLLAITLLIHIVVVGFFSIVFFPAAKHLDVIPFDFLFNGSVHGDFKIADSTSVSDYRREISQVGALFALTSPGLLITTISKIWKSRTGPHITRKRIPRIRGVFVVFIPFAILKFFSPWYALAAFTSGDGRNNLLLTMASRLSTLEPLTFVDVGILPNSLAGIISAGNGAQGLTDIRDVWAMAFVYIFSIFIIVSTFASAIVSSNTPQRWKKYFYSSSLMGGLLFATNPTLLSFCLNDGFFSLYFACAIFFMGAVFVFTCDSRFSSVVCIAAVSIALALSYVLMVPAWLALIGSMLWRNSTRTFDDRSTRLTLAVACISIAGLLYFLGEEIWNTYLQSVVLSGAVIPVGPLFLVTLVTIQLTVALLTNSSNSFLWGSIAFMGMASLVQYVVIEVANSQLFLDDDSYYGTKIIVATTVVSAMLSCVLITRCIAEHMNLLKRTFVSLVLITMILATSSELLSRQIRINSAIPSIIKGWGYPDARELQVVVSRWDGPRFLFLEYSNSLMYAEGTWRAETQQANDRLLNFWSPIFWNTSSESSVETYNWIYGNWNPADLRSMCLQMKSSIDVVITRSSTLESRLLNECDWAPIIEIHR